MKAMILAAGYGRRLLPLTETIPKPLVKVGNDALIERNINCLVSNGFNEIIINISHLGGMIKDYLEIKFPDINIIFSYEQEPLGTGGGIFNVIDDIGNESFLVMNSDIYHEIDLSKLPNETEAAHLIGVLNPKHNSKGDFSINDKTVYIKEDDNDLTWSGISLLNPSIFKDQNFKSDSFNLWDNVFPKYFKEKKITAHKSNDLWIDVGTHERLKLANSLYNDQN